MRRDGRRRFPVSESSVAHADLADLRVTVDYQLVVKCSRRVIVLCKLQCTVL